MESTGERKRIQVSTATANLLHEAHKGHWCERRKDAVVAKGEQSHLFLKIDSSTQLENPNHIQILTCLSLRER